MLGELACTGRLADGILMSLLDEIIIEMESSSSSSPASGGGTDGLLSQWKQSIEEEGPSPSDVEYDDYVPESALENLK
jgi:hypothetical protein